MENPIALFVSHPIANASVKAEVKEYIVACTDKDELNAADMMLEGAQTKTKRRVRKTDKQVGAYRQLEADFIELRACVRIRLAELNPPRKRGVKFIADNNVSPIDCDAPINSATIKPDEASRLRKYAKQWETEADFEADVEAMRAGDEKARKRLAVKEPRLTPEPKLPERDSTLGTMIDYTEAELAIGVAQRKLQKLVELAQRTHNVNHIRLDVIAQRVMWLNGVHRELENFRKTQLKEVSNG